MAVGRASASAVLTLPRPAFAQTGIQGDCQPCCVWWPRRRRRRRQSTSTSTGLPPGGGGDCVTRSRWVRPHNVVPASPPAPQLSFAAPLSSELVGTWVAAAVVVVPFLQGGQAEGTAVEVAGEEARALLAPLAPPLLHKDNFESSSHRCFIGPVFKGVVAEVRRLGARILQTRVQCHGGTELWTHVVAALALVAAAQASGNFSWVNEAKGSRPRWGWVAWTVRGVCCSGTARVEAPPRLALHTRACERTLDLSGHVLRGQSAAVRACLLRRAHAAGVVGGAQVGLARRHPLAQARAHLPRLPPVSVVEGDGMGRARG